MKRQAAFFALLALAFVQLAVPFRMIAKRQNTLEKGQLFRFRTAPVDPYDAFRGRYVALAMADDAVAVTNPEEHLYGQRIFVLLESDDEGFAIPVGIEPRRPQGAAYVQARSGGLRLNPRGQTPREEVSITYPFDRYYMNEERAPAAERAYRQHSGGDEHDAWVAVRIKDGFAVLEELYVDGMPIGDFLSRDE